jgi:hypothetical protein
MDSAGPAHASEAAEKSPSPRVVATGGLGGLEIQGQQLAASVALHSKQRQTPPANRNQVMALQRLAGNRAVARSLGTLAPAAALLQRHAPGTELPDKEARSAKSSTRNKPIPSALRRLRAPKPRKRPRRLMPRRRARRSKNRKNSRQAR